MLQRLMLTLIVTVVLSLTYKLYSDFVTPLVQPQHYPISPDVLLSEPTSRQGPREHADMASRYLPDSDWAMGAKIKFRHENMYFYCGEWEQTDESSMSFTPFAVIWKIDDEKGEHCYSVEADEAVLQFEGNVDLTHFNAELLSRALLNGKVHIQGPDQLEVHGQNFVFEKGAQHVRSDYPIAFRYAEHSGRAQNIEMGLIARDEFDPQPRLSYTGVKDVSLINNVLLNLKVDPNQPHATVTCEGRLSYDFRRQRATLSDNVILQSQPYPGEYDTMTCLRMAIDFVEKPKLNAPAVQPGQRRERDLPVKRFFAEGNNVVLSSDHQKLQASMQELEYIAEEHLLSLTSAQTVQVNVDGTQILCPSIQLWTNEKHDLTAALADGAGWIRRFEGETVVAEANWGQQMKLRPDPTAIDPLTGLPLDLVEMTGKAALKHTTQQAGLIAETIRFWIQRQPSSVKSEKGTSATARSSRDAMSQIHLRKLQADKSVKLLSSQLEGDMDLLELDFVEENFTPISMSQAKPANALAPIRQVGHQEPARLTDPTSERANPIVRQAIYVNTQHLVGKVRISPLVYAPEEKRAGIPQQELVDISDVLGIGKVKLHQDASLQTPAWAIGGDRLIVHNEGANQQRITLFGQPAMIEHDSVHLEGPQIVFERDQNRATVIGEALVRMPVKMNLNGEELPQDQMMTIRCYDELVFDGQVGRFLGRVRASLADGLLQCGELQVHLDQKINFSERPPKDQKIQLLKVFCKEHVTIDLHQYELGKLTGVIKGELAEIGLDYQTGDLLGFGQGHVMAWNFSPPKEAKPEPTNFGVAPAGPKRAPGKDWNYLRMDFDGKLEGNIKQRQGVVTQRVRCVYGPVEKALVALDRYNLPDDGGMLNCNLISGRLTSEDWNGAYEVTAEDNTELSGNLFKAQSDQLNYDSQKSLFTLKANGDNYLRFWAREKVGAPWAYKEAVGIRFAPDRKFMEIDRFRNAQGFLPN